MVIADLFQTSQQRIFRLLPACLLFYVASVYAAPDTPRQAELIRMVRNDCGSCHGLYLTGGLGLPLTPDALKEKSADSLVVCILYGRTGTPMPPWQAFLNEAEAQWIVENLKKGFPDVKPL